MDRQRDMGLAGAVMDQAKFSVGTVNGFTGKRATTTGLVASDDAVRAVAPGPE